MNVRVSFFLLSFMEDDTLEWRGYIFDSITLRYRGGGFELSGVYCSGALKEYDGDIF